MSFVAFFASFDIAFTKPEFAGCFAALVFLRCCELLQSDRYIVLLVIILLGVVDLYVLTLFFGGEPTIGSSESMVFTSYAELLFLSMHRLLFCKDLFKTFSPRIR